MENIELVIFDMDGLMFDTEKISLEVWQETSVKYGYQFDFSFFVTLIGSNLTRIKELCLNHFGNDFPFDNIMKDRLALTNKIISTKGVPVKDGLIDLLDYLKGQPIKKAVATSSGRERANMFLDNSGVSHYFDYILCGDEITRSKPDPEIFLTVAKKLNCTPSKTIVLEDSEAGITAAKNGNMLPIMIPDMKQPSDVILSKTYKCFKSLRDVLELLKKNS